MDIREVKATLDEIVYYELDGKTLEYRLNACILRMNKQNKPWYQAELLDSKCNHSVLIVPLDKVKLTK